MFKPRIRIPAYAAAAASLGALAALWCLTGPPRPPDPETEFRVVGVDPARSMSIEASDLKLGDRVVEPDGSILEVTSPPVPVGDRIVVRLPGGGLRSWKLDELAQVVRTERQDDVVTCRSGPEGSLEAK